MVDACAPSAADFTQSCGNDNHSRFLSEEEGFLKGRRNDREENLEPTAGTGNRRCTGLDAVASVVAAARMALHEHPNEF